MDLGLRDKGALVAASSRGLGKAIAYELSQEGARVAICARGQEGLEATADEIHQATGADVFPVVADVSRSDDCQRLVESAQEHFGAVDILVTNAGGPPAGYLLDLQEQDWHAAVELTLMSAVRLIGLVLPSMRERRWGRIINMTSISVKQPIEDLILSNSIRAAVVGMAKTIATQFAAEGVTVNSICPTYTLTERVRNLARARAEREGISYDEVLDAYRNQVPARRLGQPEEIAALVAFLASERAAFITGTTIQVDGGAYRGLL
jgi:3-oxoacyl-[acyl-carrier protein] reductase